MSVLMTPLQRSVVMDITSHGELLILHVSRDIAIARESDLEAKVTE